MEGINGFVPKKHERMLWQYVSDRVDLELLDKDKKVYQANLEKFDSIYKRYKDTGKIDPEVIEEMFAAYKEKMKPIGLCCLNSACNELSKKCAEQEQELKALGYDTELIFQLNKW
jgi:hypothetical protein